MATATPNGTFTGVRHYPALALGQGRCRIRKPDNMRRRLLVVSGITFLTLNHDYGDQTIHQNCKQQAR